MGDQASLTEKVDLFFKKSQGVPYAYPDEVGNKKIGLEPSLNARARAFANKQIFQKSIPASVAVDGSDLSGEVDLSMNGATIGKYRDHLINPYVRKYIDIKLDSIQQLRSYWTKGAAEATSETSNILSDAIPYNYDPAKTYTPIVKINGTTVSSDSGVKQWYFDTDAGVLTFYENLTIAENDKVTITFWRYIGPKGFDGIGSSTVDTSNLITSDYFNTLFFSNVPDVSYNPILQMATTIFITWTYPNQTASNFPGVSYLPYIRAINTLINFETTQNANSTGFDVSAAILTSNTTQNNSNYVRIDAQSTPITGIALMKYPTLTIGGNTISSGSIRNESLPINGITSTYKVYYYYNNGLTNLDGSGNKLYVWYVGNAERDPGPASTFSVFLIPGPPGPPRTLAYDSSGHNFLGVKYIAPEFADLSNNTDNTITITQYTGNFANPSGTQNRVAGYSSVGTASGITSTSLSMNSGQLLTPETVYDISVNATNSHGLSGEYVGPIQIRTPLLPASVAYTGVAGTITGTSITIKSGANTITPTQVKKVSDTAGLQGSVGVYIGATSVDLSTFTVPINSEAKRGTIGGNTDVLSAIKVDVSGGALSGVSSEVIEFKGFGTTTGNKLGNIAITAGNRTDVPAAAPALHGWYQTYTGASASISTGSGTRITSSSAEYQVNLSVLQDSNVFASKGYSAFRYSPAVGTPDITSGGITVPTPTTKVSGVAVHGGSFNIDASYNITGMGSDIYYYPQDNIITYSTNQGANTTTPTIESNLTNVIEGITSGKFDTGTIRVKRDAFPLTASTFATEVKLSGIPKNISSGGSIKDIASVSVIVDPNSVSLLTDTSRYNLGTIPTITSLHAYVAGAHRFTSGTNKTTLPLIAPFSIGIENQYDHTTSLSTNDLQIANGLFRGRNNQIVGYLDYSSTLGNIDNNYSSIQSEIGYRFATFVWTFATTFDNPVVSAMTFNFTNSTSMSNDNTKLYYRFVGTDGSGNVVSSLDATANTSVWAAGTEDAGQNVGVALDSGTFANSLYAVQVLNGYSSGSLPTVQVRITKPGAFDSSVQTTKYILARVAIKMDSDATFSGLQLKLE
jgi:hypothetical protein